MTPRQPSHDQVTEVNPVGADTHTHDDLPRVYYLRYESRRVNYHSICLHTGVTLYTHHELDSRHPYTYKHSYTCAHIHTCACGAPYGPSMAVPRIRSRGKNRATRALTHPAKASGGSVLLT